MTIDRRYFVDVFGDIVNEVRKVYDPIGLEKPYYIYGHPLDITKRLSMTDTFKKYPLICLLLDDMQKHGESISFEYSVSPTVLILESTASSYISEERTVKTFKPILYPIATELIKQVNKSQHLQSMHKVGNRFTWTDKYFWGKEGIKMKGYDGFIFNDYLDGIELSFSELKVYNNSNC